jgi:uncharacterized protein YecT (DUF1311 family)
MRVSSVAAIIIGISVSGGVVSNGDVSRAAVRTEVESKYTKAYTECPGFKSGVTPDMLDCISTEFDIQDKRLNIAYAAAMRTLSPSRKASLRTAQRAWITYRDVWCNITFDEESGQAEHVAANQCMLDETIRQTIKLNELTRYASAG